MKFSQAQQRAVDKLRDGWYLRRNLSADGSWNSMLYQQMPSEVSLI